MIVNLAGHQVSIFLFRFVVRKNTIKFDLNEVIAKDMYPDIEEQMQPLAQACGETLLRYKHLCKNDTLMDGSILVDGCFEVMLSKGFGKHFVESEKQSLFNDAHKISNLLQEVMRRRTIEEEQGLDLATTPVTQKIIRTATTSKRLEELGKQQHELQQLIYDAFGIRPKPGMKRLTPDDLPNGVVAKNGYDHRGRCVAFEHHTLGDIGKIVFTSIEGDKLLMEAEVSRDENLEEKKKILETIFATISTAMNSNTQTAL